MFQIHLYKLFNPDLTNFLNSQLLMHWNKFGKNESRISCFESFFEKYPYYNHDLYKLYNPDIKINDKIQLMIHWHLYGINENRICSDEHFNNLYPYHDFTLLINNNPDLSTDLYKIKNKYHREENYRLSFKDLNDSYTKLSGLIETTFQNDSIDNINDDIGLVNINIINNNNKIDNNIHFEKIDIDNIDINLLYNNINPNFKINYVLYIPSNKNIILYNCFKQTLEYVYSLKLLDSFIFIKDIYSCENIYNEIKKNNYIIFETNLSYKLDIVLYNLEKYIIYYNKKTNSFNNKINWYIIPYKITYFILNDSIYNDIISSIKLNNINKLDYILFKNSEFKNDIFYAIRNSPTYNINGINNIISSYKKILTVDIINLKNYKIYNDTHYNLINIEQTNNKKLIYNPNSKNIIVKLDNNFNNDIIRVLIGLSQAIKYKYNFYISNVKKTYKLFSNFKTFFNDFQFDSNNNKSIHLNLNDDNDFNLNYNNFILEENYYIDYLNNTSVENTFYENLDLGIKQNNVVSNEYSLYKMFNYFNLTNMQNIYKNKLSVMNNDLYTLGIYLSKNDTDNNLKLNERDKYFKKTLSNIPFHNMNVILFFEDDNFKDDSVIDNFNSYDDVNSSFKCNFYLKYIKTYYNVKDIIFNSSFNDGSDFLLLSLCDIVISYSSDIPLYASYLGNIKKLYYHYSFEEKILSRNLLTNKISFVDDNFDDLYLNGNILISEHKKYFYNDGIYNLDQNNINSINSENNSINNSINNILYIYDQDIIDNLYKKYNNDEISIRLNTGLKSDIINFNKTNIRMINIKHNDGIEDGIFYNGNNYYFKVLNNIKKFDNVEFDSFKRSLPWDINYIYIKQTYQNYFFKKYEKDIILIDNLNPEFKINIVYIIDGIERFDGIHDSEGIESINNDNNNINKEQKYLFNNFIRLLENLNDCDCQYSNFNIIVFFNGIKDVSFLKEKIEFYKKLKLFNLNLIENNDIYYLSCENKKNHIEILYHLTKLSQDNSIIFYMNNSFPIDPRINLSYINNLFIARNLLFTNYYNSNNINSLIFYKKEILCSIPNNHIELMKNIMDLITYFKNITNNYYCVKSYFNNKKEIRDIDAKDKNKINKTPLQNYILNEFNMSVYYNIIYDYQLINYYKASLYKNFSEDTIKYINATSEIIENSDNDIEKIDFFVYFYNKNTINYEYFINNHLYKYNHKIKDLEIYIKKDVEKYCENGGDKVIQLIVFLHDFIKNEDALNIIDNIYNIYIDSKELIQINVIHFGYAKYDSIFNKNYINYFYINSNFLQNKYKYNRSFANNLMIYVLNNIDYKHIYFYNIESPIKKDIFKNNQINKNGECESIENDEINIFNILEKEYIIELNNNNILSNYSSLLIKKDIFKFNYLKFDPEIFLDYSGYEIIYFIEKINKLKKLKQFQFDYHFEFNSNISHDIIQNNNSIYKYCIEENYGDSNNFLNNDYNNHISNYNSNNNNYSKNTDDIYIYKIFYSKIIDIFNFLKINDFSILYNYLENIEFIKKINNELSIWDKIDSYIINLDKRLDRYEETYKELNKISLNNYTRFSAIYPEIEEIKESNLINPSKLWKKRNIEYLKCAGGCKMSHLQILKSAYSNSNSSSSSSSNNTDYIMILEDDVVFIENTNIYLSLALNDLENIDWDILYLGVNLKEKDNAIRVKPNLLKIRKGLTTTAQLFKRKNLKMIIDIIETSDKEIDNTYNDLLEDKYCVYPICVYQRASFSDINKEDCNYGEFHKKYFY